MAGTKSAHECTLIDPGRFGEDPRGQRPLCGWTQRTFGVFRLCGKLLNVREANHKQIMENATSKIKKIMGLQQGKQYEAARASAMATS